MAGSLTSDQLNYLVWRYLQESGFFKSSVAFASESSVQDYHTNFAHSVKVGALIDLAQRGLMYNELESIARQTIKSNDPKTGSYFPTVETPRAQETVTTQENDEDEDVEMGGMPTNRKHDRDDVNGISKDAAGGAPRKKRRKNEATPTVQVPPDALQQPPTPPVIDEMVIDDTEVSPEPETKVTNGETRGVQVHLVEIPSNEGIKIPSKTPVQHCSWNPKLDSCLAVSSMDVAAQIWEFKEQDKVQSVWTSGESARQTRSNRERATTLQWDESGSSLGTGGWSGKTLIRGLDGREKATCGINCGAVIRLRWNKSGRHLVTLHVKHPDSQKDDSLCLWRVNDGVCASTVKGKFSSFVWISDTQIAVGCSDNGNIVLYNLRDNSLEFYQRLLAHESEVEQLEWDEVTGRLAAAGEQDMSITVWKAASNSGWKSPEWHIKSRNVAVMALAWQPIPQSKASTNGTAKKAPEERILAAGYHDGTIMLYAVESQTCVATIATTGPFGGMAFNPDGTLIASLDTQRHLSIWNAKDGLLKAIYPGRVEGSAESVEEGTQVSVMWNGKGDKIATLAGGVCVVVPIPEEVRKESS